MISLMHNDVLVLSTYENKSSVNTKVINFPGLYWIKNANNK